MKFVGDKQVVEISAKLLKLLKVQDFVEDNLFLRSPFRFASKAGINEELNTSAPCFPHVLFFIQ